MITAIGEVMAKCYEKGWITTRDGNASLRRSLDGQISQYMYITPKGVCKNTIKPEDMIKLSMGESSDKLPVSTEFYMHHHLLVDATTTRAVLHVHPTYVVAAIYAGLDLQAIASQFPEISRYTKVGPTVPIVPAGSHELATLTNLAMRDGQETGPIRFDIVGQANHGVCSVGKNPWDAYEHIERLDHICQIVLASGVK